MTFNEIETRFNEYIKYSEIKDTDINMDELNEISDEIIKAKEYLNSFASGERKSIREKAFNQLSVIPLLGSWAKDKAQEMQVQTLKDSSVKGVLDGIFKSFDKKKNRLIELSSSMQTMKEELSKQEQVLNTFIQDLDSVISETTDSVEKMKALEMSVTAQSQDKIVKEMLYNNIYIITELLENLHYKIVKTLPVIKNTLNNSLNIVGTINSIKDAVEMMNTLESLSNDINKQSTNNIQNLIIETTKTLSEGTDIEFFRESANRNKQFNTALLEARKKHIKKTVQDYNTLQVISSEQSNQLEYRIEEESKLLKDLS